MTTIISDVKLINNHLTSPNSKGVYSTELDAQNPLVKELLNSMVNNICLVHNRKKDNTLVWFKAPYKKGYPPSFYIAESIKPPKLYYTTGKKFKEGILPTAVVTGDITLDIVYKPLKHYQIISAVILQVVVKGIQWN